MVDCQTAPIYALVCLLVALVLSVLAIAGGIVGCCAAGCCGEQSNKKEAHLESAVPGAPNTKDEPPIVCDRRLLVGSWFCFIPVAGLLYGAVHFAFYCP
jgi:hypothetical protein